jgi:hypothetical protein
VFCYDVLNGTVHFAWFYEKPTEDTSVKLNRIFFIKNERNSNSVKLV